MSIYEIFTIFQRFLIASISSKIKINLSLHSSNICSFHVRERNGIRGGVTAIQAVQTHEYCKFHTRNFTFFKDFSFSQFFRKIKINPTLHSSNICSFHVRMDNSIRWGVTEIQAVQTRKYCKSIQEILHFFKDFSFSQFSRKIKINPSLHTSNICSFHARERNGIRGGVTAIQAVQTHEYCKFHTRNFTFFKDFSFSQFFRKIIY